MAKLKAKSVTAKEFDRKAEAGEDLSDMFDADSGTKRFNVDLPIWAMRALDAECGRRGVARQALVKGWIVDKLDEIRREESKLRVVSSR